MARVRGAAVALGVLALVLTGCGAAPTTSTGSSSSAALPPPVPKPTADAPGGNADPARFAAQVRTRAAEAGVSPQLVMAILYNESYKPHDPALERQWQRLKPGAAFGVANMHEATFEQTKKGRAFAGRTWQQLPDDPDLAIQAEAWYLHDLTGQLPAKRSGSLSADELLALGYNAGPGNMKAFARGAKPGPQAQSYLDTLRGNWDKAGNAVGQG